MEVVEKRKKTTLPFFRFNFFLKHTQNPLSTPKTFSIPALSPAPPFPTMVTEGKLHSLPPCVHTSMATPESLTTHFCPIVALKHLSCGYYRESGFQVFIFTYLPATIYINDHHYMNPPKYTPSVPSFLFTLLFCQGSLSLSVVSRSEKVIVGQRC